MEFQNTRAFAQELDRVDPLKKYRESFHIPVSHGREVIYFTGNSLGLQPRTSEAYVEEVMHAWKELAVEGHFHATKPWWDYHERLIPPLAGVVGALPEEVTVMNTLTVNLHLLMISFYRPTPTRFRILCEEKAFPSDQYMLASQVRFHGLDPKEAIVPLRKRPGEHHWRTADILEEIARLGDSLALVFLGGVHYYNGQVFDIPAITKAGRSVGARVGWDLAHAAGNISLSLHDWQVDFAAWCSYKYMNSGPGNASGVFIHKKHLNDSRIPRFEGWWGNRKETRFQMRPEIDPIPTADAWQLSNPPVLALAPYLASLRLFEEVGMPALIEKSERLTAYLEFIISEVASAVDGNFEIITPAERGCQLSVLLHGEGRPLFDFLTRNGVITDWREPNVIRLAPAPFYNQFEEMYEFGTLLRQGVLEN